MVRGVYVGGIDAARNKVAAGEASPEQFRCVMDCRSLQALSSLACACKVAAGEASPGQFSWFIDCLQVLYWLGL